MNEIEELVSRNPWLKVCTDDIHEAIELLLSCFRRGGKVLVCGNGGSAADSEHITGELMKCFRKKRPIDTDVASKLPLCLAQKLEGALPAISLVSMSGLISAYANDVDWDMVFAQQVYGLGVKGDVLLVLSTSGNSSNCINAALVAKAKGIHVIALTGMSGGALAAHADVSIKVPKTDTDAVQEAHLPIYHVICAVVENDMFGD